jgi:hypothetical protein
MDLSKPRRPVLPPNLVMLSIDDPKAGKGTNLRTDVATTSANSFERTRPMLETVADLESERKAKEILRMQRADITTANVTELKELWFRTSKQTKIDIECKLFEFAVESSGTALSDTRKKEFDAVRILSARTLFELPIEDKKEQMLRLNSAIARQMSKVVEPTLCAILAVTEISRYSRNQ